MAAIAKLSELAAALELPEEWGAWLDRETGEVVVLDPDTSAAARAIAAGDPRYLALPDKFDFLEYRHIEDVVRDLGDNRDAEYLWLALKGKGAFRRFKDAAARQGLLDSGYAYRAEAMDRFILRWVEANEVAVDQSPRGPAPSQNT